MSLSIPFPFLWLLNKKAARVEVNISLAFLYWEGIALHPWPFVSDIAIFVLKGDVKLQLINLVTDNRLVQHLQSRISNLLTNFERCVEWSSVERTAQSPADVDSRRPADVSCLVAGASQSYLTNSWLPCAVWHSWHRSGWVRNERSWSRQISLSDQFSWCAFAVC